MEPGTTVEASLSFNYENTFIKTLLVQSVERRFPKPDAVGSSPTGRVKKLAAIINI